MMSEARFQMDMGGLVSGMKREIEAFHVVPCMVPIALLLLQINVLVTQVMNFGA